MIEHDKLAIRLELVDCMHLVSARNRVEFEKRIAAFIAALENETDTELIGFSLYSQGVRAFMRGNYEEAKDFFNKIFDLTIKTKKNDLHGMAYMGLGLTARSTGDFDIAIAHMTSGAELIDPKGVFREFLAYCYQSLGDIHLTISEYPLAIGYFERAHESAGGEDNKMAKFRYHMGLGGCYVKMREYEQGKQHLTQALEIPELPPTAVSRIENDLGILHYEMDDYEGAEKFLKSSLACREENGLQDAACTTMMALVEVYLEQDRTKEVFNLVDRCQLLIDKFQTKAKRLKMLNIMARAYTKSKDFDKAIQCYEDYIKLYEEIKSEQERNIFKFKNEQIEKQKQIISEKHDQLAATFEEIKRLKVNRKSVIFSWITIIILVVISELVLDPLIENYAYNNILSLLVKVLIALLFKPLDGMYEKLLWERTIRKVD